MKREKGEKGMRNCELEDVPNMGRFFSETK